MQETPPYSIAEIRLLLSQYLDGALEPEQMVNLDALMEQFPHYRDELLKMQATRGAIQSSLERATEAPPLQFNKISDMVWKNIESRLEADKQCEPQTYDAEFVSAYYDGQIPADDAQRQAFEGQLYQNAEASRMLAEMGQISEVVRQFGYRLENACPVDVTSQVMAAFSQEQATTASEGAVAELEVAVDADLEMISAYADQELTPRETIEANRLIESRQDAREALAQFNRLSEQLQSFSERLQAQAPDLWPVLEPVLQKTTSEGGIVVPFDRTKRVKDILKIALPATAAAVLLLVSLSGISVNNATGAGSVASSGALNAQLASYRVQPGSQELASVPAGAMGRQMRFASQEEASMDMAPMMEGAATVVSAPRPLKPILEPSPKIAAKPGVGMSADGDSARNVPSSEEYLFDALNEQMPNEDISNILGK